MPTARTVPAATAAKAAQYVRMSTDMQKYSLENQAAAIAVYAARHGIEIVKTYADSGKSGLTIRDRIGLQQLINDVRSGHPGFQTILVYDVSRWGRFQDADESAYYEFICRESGISIRYCAEEFENDGSLSATIIKAMKRAMAAEYSRELSNRVAAGQRNLGLRGFHIGSRPGYGLRRMLVNEHGGMRTMLKDGEWKFVHSDRTVLVPGPPEEIKWIRWIFEQFTLEKRTISSIASELNARSVPNVLGTPWGKHNVRSVLSNEKYIGNNVFHRTSVRLRSKRIHIHEGQWIRAKQALRPILDEDLYAAAQARLATNLHRLTKFDLLDHLTALWCVHGKLSAALIEKSPFCPSSNTYARIFGGALEAFRHVGYPHSSRRPAFISIERHIAQTIVSILKEHGLTAQITRRRRQSRLLANGEIVISVVLAHPRYTTLDGKPRWILGQSVPHKSDIAVLATFDEKPLRVLEYYLLPGFLLTNPQQLFFDRNPIRFEAFRSPTLKPLINLLRREALPAGVALRAPAPRAKSQHQALRFNLARRPCGAKLVLRAFERCSRRTLTFVDMCERFRLSQDALDRDLITLFQDDEFCQLLKSEVREDVPALLFEHLSRMKRRDDESEHVWFRTEPLPPRSLQVAFHRLQPTRCRHIEEMRAAFADTTPFFLKLLVAASRPEELARTLPKSRFMRSGEVRQIKEQFRPLEDSARSLMPGFAKSAHCFATTRAYVRSLLKNEHIETYLRAIHPKIHRRLKTSNSVAQ